MVLLLPASFVLGQKNEPARRRARIRTYDQSAEIMRFSRPVESPVAAEADLDRKIRTDIQAPTSLQSPVSHISLLPSMGTASWNDEVPEEEDEDESWVTPSDFLLEEDRPEEDDLLSSESTESTPDDEMEITDWDKLQQFMIEEALTEDEPELNEEESDALTREEEREDVSTRTANAMDIAEVAPLDNLQNANTQRTSTRDQGLRPEAFVPLLRMEPQREGEISRQQRDEMFELKGSQKMLNNLKEKWTNPATATVSAPNSLAERRALPSERRMGRNFSELRQSSTFILGNPAVSSLPKPEPVVPETSIQTERSLPQPPRQTSDFPKADYRIRSRVGLPAGM